VPLALSLVAAGAGAYVTSALALLAGALAWACFALSRAQDDARACALACVALTAAPVPLVGTFWPVASLLTEALGSRAFAPLPGAAVVAACAAAWLYASLGAWRAYYRAFPAPRSSAPRALAVLAAALIALPLVLGFRKRMLGSGGDSLLEEWLERLAQVHAPAREVSAGVAVALALIASGASLAGWAIARRRAAEGEAAVDASRALAGLTAGDALVERPLVTLRTLVVNLDRWVIDGLVGGAGLAVRASAWVVARADLDLVGSPADGAAARLARAARALRPSPRVERALVVALALALLTLLVYPALSR